MVRDKPQKNWIAPKFLSARVDVTGRGDGALREQPPPLGRITEALEGRVIERLGLECRIQFNRRRQFGQCLIVGTGYCQGPGERESGVGELCLGPLKSRRIILL